ncbi:hypothetical protein HDV00_001480 [Rhizophlyctis rosea]|nr:hypothetical protein HDV00_001480 [Rhizophlyctis rosea]
MKRLKALERDQTIVKDGVGAAMFYGIQARRPVRRYGHEGFEEVLEGVSDSEYHFPLFIATLHPFQTPVPDSAPHKCAGQWAPINDSNAGSQPAEDRAQCPARYFNAGFYRQLNAIDDDPSLSEDLMLVRIKQFIVEHVNHPLKVIKQSRDGEEGK